MPKITKRTVDAACPGEREQLVRDDELKGFGLKVTPAGAKSFFLEYRLPGGRGAPKGRIVIGSYGALTPDSARREAHRLLAMVRSGHDPRDTRRQSVAEDALAFNRYYLEFIEGYAKPKGLRTWRHMQKHLERHAVPYLGKRPLPKINRKDVDALLGRCAETSVASARYLHAILGKMFRWAVGRGDLSLSPMLDMPKPGSSVARDRILSDMELIAIWEASKGEGFGAAIRILILTGQRRSEVLGMRIEELDRANATWTIPAERSKNGKASIVPLSKAALMELETLGIADRKHGFIFTTTGETPISGISKIKARLDRRYLAWLKDHGEPQNRPWRLHDIRRTVATGLQRLGVRFEVTEAVLNHVSGAKSGVAGVYQRHDWKDEKRAALEAWGRRVEALVNGEGSNVIPLLRNV